MDNSLKKIKDSFTSDLITEGDGWRIFRTGTYIDLAGFCFHHYENEHKEKFLIDIINWCFKALLIQDIGTIDFRGDSETFSSRFNTESERIMQAYEKLLGSFDFSIGSNIKSLGLAISYLKVAAETNVSDLQESFEDVIKTAYAMLD